MAFKRRTPSVYADKGECGNNGHLSRNKSQKMLLSSNNEIVMYRLHNINVSSSYCQPLYIYT